MSEAGSLRKEFDWKESDPTIALIETIDEFEHGEVTDPLTVLDSPLHSYVETDALNTLVQNGDSISITLTISQYLVQILENTVKVSYIEE